MAKRRRCWVAALASALAVVAAPSAQAAYVTTFAEVGSNVVEVGGGTLDLTDLERIGGIFTKLFVAPNEPSYTSGAKGDKGDIYEGALSGPANWGPGPTTFASSSSGDLVGLVPSGAEMIVPDDYFWRRAVGNLDLPRRVLRFTRPDAWLLCLQLGDGRPRRHVHAQCRRGLRPRAFDLGDDAPWICGPWLRGGAAKDQPSSAGAGGGPSFGPSVRADDAHCSLF